MAIAAREIAPSLKEPPRPPAGIALHDLTMEQFMDIDDE